MRLLPVFVPLQPRSCATLDAAMDFGSRHAAALERRLADLAGHVQVSVTLEFSGSVVRRDFEPADRSGRAWLLARAGRCRMCRDTSDAAGAELRAALSHLPVRASREVVRWTSLRVDLLVSADEPSQSQDVLRAFQPLIERLSPEWRRGVSVTGPWPALAFAKLEEMST